MELGQKLSRFDVGRVFLLDAVGAVSRHEAEGVDVLVQVLQGKIERGRQALEKRQLGVLLRLKVMEGDLVEIADNEVTGSLVVAPAILQGADVGHTLGLCFA